MRTDAKQYGKLIQRQDVAVIDRTRTPATAPSAAGEAEVKLVAEMLSYDADYATNKRQKKTVSPKWSRYFESSMSYTGTRAGAARKKDPFAYREETRRGRRMLGRIVSTLNQAGADPRHKRQEAIQKQYFERQQSSREDDDSGLRESSRKFDEIQARQQASYELQVVRPTLMSRLRASNAKSMFSRWSRSIQRCSGLPNA